MKNSEDLAAVNKQLIEVCWLFSPFANVADSVQINRHIIDANEEVVATNTTLCVAYFQDKDP